MLDKLADEPFLQFCSPENFSMSVKFPFSEVLFVFIGKLKPSQVTYYNFTMTVGLRLKARDFYARVSVYYL